MRELFSSLEGKYEQLDCYISKQLFNLSVHMQYQLFGNLMTQQITA